MIQAVACRIEAAGGSPLAAQFFRPEGPARGALLLVPAMGVTQRPLFRCRNAGGTREYLFGDGVPEGSMQLDLTPEDAVLLHGLLQDHLPALRLEVARTEAKDLRHLLVRRLELVERLLAALAPSAQPAAP